MQLNAWVLRRRPTTGVYAFEFPPFAVKPRETDATQTSEISQERSDDAEANVEEADAEEDVEMEDAPGTGVVPVDPEGTDDEPDAVAAAKAKVLAQGKGQRKSGRKQKKSTKRGE